MAYEKRELYVLTETITCLEQWPSRLIRNIRFQYSTTFFLREEKLKLIPFTPLICRKDLSKLKISGFILSLFSEILFDNNWAHRRLHHRLTTYLKTLLANKTRSLLGSINGADITRIASFAEV